MINDYLPFIPSYINRTSYICPSYIFATLVAEVIHVLLGDGVAEEGAVLRLGLESGFESGTLRRVGSRGLGGLCSGLEGVLRLYILTVGGLGRVQQVHT